MPGSPSCAARSAASPSAAAKPQRNGPAATRISLLAIPLLAVALASALRHETGPRVFTKAELAQYVDTRKGLKVAICGQVFDVSKGAEFYAKGAGYGFFAGRDASLAFATGNFKTNLTDNVGAPASPLFRSPRRRGEVDARNRRSRRSPTRSSSSSRTGSTTRTIKNTSTRASSRATSTTRRANRRRTTSASPNASVARGRPPRGRRSTSRSTRTARRGGRRRSVRSRARRAACPCDAGPKPAPNGAPASWKATRDSAPRTRIAP